MLAPGLTLEADCIPDPGLADSWLSFQRSLVLGHFCVTRPEHRPGTR